MTIHSFKHMNVVAGIVLAATSLSPMHVFAQPSTSNGAKAPIKYTDYSKSGDRVGGYATLSVAEKVLGAYPGGTIKDRSGYVVYQEPDFTTVDLRFPAPNNVTAAAINRFLLEHGSPLSGLGETFAFAERVYGVNASYLLSHAIEESDWGRSPLAVSKNNLYGTGAFDAHTNLAGGFPSLDYAIRYQAWVVRKNYLNPGFSHYVAPTLSGMNQNYASDVHWADNVRAVMNQLALFLGDNVKSYKQYVPGTHDPTPIVMTEPAYYLNGANAVTGRDSNYKGVPVYPTVGKGQLQLFSRPLKLGDSGDDVSTLQTALNDLSKAGLTVNGLFDTQTQTALEQFQTDHGMPANGTCDFNLWTNDLGVPTPKMLNVASRVRLDKVMQGMVGSTVATWYHVQGEGWVNAYDLKLTNVYRIAVRDPKSPTYTSIRIYDPHKPSRIIATLHAGDTVVSIQPLIAHNHYLIQFANATPKVGILKRTDAYLIPVH